MRPDLTRQNIAAIGRTDATSPTIVGRFVFERVVFPEQGVEQVCFTRKQYLFAHRFKETADLEAACELSGMTRDQALRFLKRPDVSVWMNSKRKMLIAKDEWSAPEKWAAEGERMYQTPNVPKHKLEIWKEFGDRCCPKPTRETSSREGAKVVINIDPGAVQEAFRRQQAIDAQIVKESAA
jgi:hypothetical protein